MGWIPESSMVAEIRSAVAALQRDGVTDPIATADGWHIVKLLEIGPPAVVPLQEVRPQVVAALRLRKAQELEGEYLDALLKRFPISVSAAELERMRAGLK